MAGERGPPAADGSDGVLNKEEIRRRLYVALDVPDWPAARRLVELLAGRAGGFKVGLELFCAEGLAVVEKIKARGAAVFLDLKLHDIPRTVARTVRVLAAAGPDIVNVHAAGGRAMMEAAAAAAREGAEAAGRPAPLVVAVTVLTSLDDRAWREELGLDGTVAETVVGWARLAKQAGLDGVVASPRETEAVRTACGPGFVVVTPGLRPAGFPAADQRRFLTPAEAWRRGADYLVVGRPVTAAPDPVAALEAVVAEIAGP
jgi:orotidine-5'-phosphate decarboxylase